jgi:hypothetical protein
LFPGENCRICERCDDWGRTSKKVPKYIKFEIKMSNQGPSKRLKGSPSSSSSSAPAAVSSALSASSSTSSSSSSSSQPAAAAAAVAAAASDAEHAPFDGWLLQMGKDVRYGDLTQSDRACVIWARIGSFLSFGEQEGLSLECVVLAKAMQPLVPVWIAVECPPVPAGDDEGDDEDDDSEEEESDEEDDDEHDNACNVDDDEGVDSEEESDEEDEPHAKTTLTRALAAFKKFRKTHPKRRFEIQLGTGAHKTGFQVVNHDEDEDDDLPGVVGGGDFRGLNLEGGGWDGLRIKTPEVCADYGQEGLASVAVLEGVQTIGVRAFYGCSSLASVALPDALETIGESAFEGCSSLASVAFPDALQTIGESAFYGCSSLASVAFPDALQTIGEWAFYECSSLASVSLSASTPIYGAFDGCEILRV